MNRGSSRTSFNKIIVIAGPTASGKSELAVKLAQQFGGEVVSADSRQVYRGLDIGTGKITKREMGGIRHHLLDIASPKRQLSAAQYQTRALRAVRDILKRRKLPIVCGGTGFYIQSIVDGIVFPEVKPNAKLRKGLERKSVTELATILKKLDLRRWKEIDRNNPHRLIRAIEIATALGTVPRVETGPLDKAPLFQTLRIGISMDNEKLKMKIETRLISRLKKGMIAEAKRLHTKGLSYKRMEELGLEYRYLARFLKREISKKDMTDTLSSEIWRYAKRQMTWFKRDTRIVWIKPNDMRTAQRLVRSFLLPPDFSDPEKLQKGFRRK